jgi:TolB protein
VLQQSWRSESVGAVVALALVVAAGATACSSSDGSFPVTTRATVTTVAAPSTVTARPPTSSTSAPAPITVAAPPVDLAGLSGTIVYSAEVGGSQDVFLLRLDGSEPIRLTDGPEEEFDPDLSPDGTTIAYRRNPRRDSDEADIWTMHVDGTAKRNLTNAPELSNWAPAWTPDGRIAFSSMRGSTGALELWTMAADGSDPRRVCEGWCEYAQPSPSGLQFVCAAAVGGRYDIVVVDTSGLRRSLTRTPVTEFGPSWSPDGQWVVFSRDLSDRWELLRIRPDGSDEQRIADEGVFATWDPAGHVVWSGPGGINVANADGSARVAIDLPAQFVSWGS